MTTLPTTNEIWSDLSADLRSFIRRRVRDEHVTDDLLQETFVRIHRYVDNLEETDRMAAWVFQIARNVVVDYYRKTEIASLENDDLANLNDNRQGVPTGCGNLTWLHELVQSLPEAYRLAVRMAEIEGESQQAVADRLGLSLSGAKSRIQRGRVMLKEILQRCCVFELDARGKVMECTPKPNQQVCSDCGE